MCIGTLPGASAAPAQHRLMDRMIDAAFDTLTGQASKVVVTGDARTGTVAVTIR